MDSKLIIFLGICFTGFVFGRCPYPEDLPAKSGDKFLCARAYDTGSRVLGLSCEGDTRDIPNEEIYRGTAQWNDRVSAIVVRPGCSLQAFENGQLAGKEHVFDSGIYKYLESIGWNNRISSWACNCQYSNAPFSCNPREYERQLQVCYNPDVGEMSCEYSVQTGLVIGSSVTHGRSVSHSVEFSMGLVFKEIFSVGLSASTTTSHDWSHSSSEEFGTVSTHKVTCNIPVGHRVLLKQAVGECGDTRVYTTQYVCEGVSAQP